MKKIVIKFQLLILMAAACAVSVFGQNARLRIDHLDKLFPKAVETIDVTVDGNLLKLASKFLKTDRANEAAAREIVSMLKGVYVRGVEFDKDGEYSEADVEAVRQQLRAPGWDRVVGVRNKRDKGNVEVYLMLGNNGTIDGVGVLLFEARQLMVVNVVGQIDPEKITELRGQFGIPGDFDLDFSGARRTRRDDVKKDN
ncbi:MAG: DUF4252 domain-containing protein [Blastocatellia bacterium]